MIKRKILPLLEEEMTSDKVIVLTGMRRTGKTTLARYLYEAESNRRKIFLDLENPLNQSYFSSIDYDAIKTLFDRLALGTTRNLLVVLDEIQNVRSLPSIVKYLYDHYLIKFVLTGSASFYLKNLFSESLAGRKRIYELYPLDFDEFLSYKAPNLVKPTLDEKISPAVFYLLEKYVFEYVTYGGFPSVVTKPSHEEKIKEIEDIFSSYYQKEVLVLSDFRKTEVVKAIINLLLTRCGSKVDISKIAAELGVSRITVEEYLDFLERTYFIRRISRFSPNTDVSIRGQQKVYLVDNGFLTMKGNVEEGSLFENAVFNLLRTRGYLYYYQIKSGAEIDFIVKSQKEESAFEVKLFGRKTDANKLRRSASKLHMRRYYIVSQKYIPTPNVVFAFQL